jgi:hypothetical protein
MALRAAKGDEDALVARVHAGIRAGMFSAASSRLLGASGVCILTALVGDARLQCGSAELADALMGSVSEIHRRLPQQHLA